MSTDMFPDAAVAYIIKEYSKMPTLTLTRGLPGSGKTTWAKQQRGAIRANRDDLRMSLFGRWTGLSFEQENTITEVQRSIAATALKAGLSVIVDDMNLRPKYIRPWNEFALEHGAHFHIEEFGTPIEVCIARDRERARVVGEDVIRDIAQKYMPKGQFLPYDGLKTVERNVAPAEIDLSLPWVWIVDIDGTMTTGPHDRDAYDFSKVSQDLPRWPVVEMVGDRLSNDGLIVFMSGREDSCREDTLTWLDHYLPSGFEDHWELHMRKTGDKRADSIVKRELFDAHIRGKYNVEHVLDDRDSVVAMWRKDLGLTCLQVDYGNF